METAIDQFLTSHPFYLNKSELVRDAIRHLLTDVEAALLSGETLRVIERGRTQVAEGRGRTLEQVRAELDD